MWVGVGLSSLLSLGFRCFRESIFSSIALGLLLLLAIGGFKSGPRLQGFRLECLGLIWGLGFRA